MEELKEVEECVFISKKEKYDFVFESEYKSKYYEFKVIYKNKTYIVGFAQANNGLNPQVELHDKFILLGVNDSLMMIDLEQKRCEKYKIFPVFYQFLVKDNYIVAIGELSLLIFDNFKIKYEKHFEEIVDFCSFDGDILILKDFNGKTIQINIVTCNTN